MQNFFKLITLSIVLISNLSLAQDQDKTVSPLMICLAQEEVRFHRNKDLGPEYVLSQKIFQELNSVGEVFLKRDYQQKVCQFHGPGPSLRFLQAVLTDKTKIFDKKRMNAGLNEIQFKHLNSIYLSAGRMFLDYISNLDAIAPNAHCLNKNLPGLETIREQILYLEAEISLQQLLNQKSVKEIFRKLPELNSIFKKCSKKKKQ